ncbi:nucleotidyl transferase AbiEii/AbiGii toxin family protein [Agrobacterium rubi]|nr:nucleotidyl transferase AbiEii/AbiGii toxin family protein [Agrobacterium rubi]NTF24873.1 nucleotidyl transferase AbiEii/AbiGii toxin family protein [Agrobacterium rubi]
MMADIGQRRSDSIIQRARNSGIPTVQMLQRFAQERFTVRVGLLDGRQALSLKGGVMYHWDTSMADLRRPTADIDMHSYGDRSITHEEILELFNSACAMEMDDGCFFEVAKTSVLEHEHHQDDGIRVHLRSRIGKSMAPLYLDVGIGGEPPVGLRDLRIIPMFESDRTVTMKAQPWSYNIAEKLHSIVVRGLSNTRMKDYRDLWVLLGRDIDRQAVEDACRHTFRIRATDLAEDVPEGLLPEFAEARQADWERYIERNGIVGVPSMLADVVSYLNAGYAGAVMETVGLGASL